MKWLPRATGLTAPSSKPISSNLRTPPPRWCSTMDRPPSLTVRSWRRRRQSAATPLWTSLTSMRHSPWPEAFRCRTGRSRYVLSSNANDRLDPRSSIERVFREEAGRLTASLVRLLGDFDLAEEMVAEAVVEALVRWPVDGVPDRPSAWLMTTARNRAIDRIRREARYQDKLAMLAAPPRHCVQGTRRPPAPDLHVLPSGAGFRCPSSAHPPCRSRTDNRRDCPHVAWPPSPRWPSG